MYLIDLLRYILELLHNLTSNFGWSIILLSLSITIMMLPLFWIAELIQHKERTRKLYMQPALDKLKDVTNKQEKYYYTRRIYKQFNYSPIYSLTGLLGLLIQVPFFIAAYWMLIEYTPLQGVSFGPIQDLSLPDGLISFNKFSINVLPVIMTLVNIYAGYLYTKGTKKSERIQLVIIALIFLILLYGLSSALVLYWTMNNVFSIGKNWLLNDVIKEDHYERVSSKYLSRIQGYKYLVAPLVFAVFPLFSFYLENIEELYFSQIIPFLSITILSTFVIILASKYLFKSQHKAVLFSFLLVLLFFSFGHMRDAFSILNLNVGFLKLGLLYFLVFGLTLFILFRIKRNLDKVVKYLSILAFCLLSLILVRIIVYEMSAQPSQIQSNDFSRNIENNEVENGSSPKNQEYPDIYFIVMDGYANSETLRSLFEYDNSDIEDFLKSKGFYIGTESRSNYLLTFLSLASTLNMDYIANSVNLDETATDRKVVAEHIKQNKVAQYLSEKGYKSIHFSSNWTITNKNDYADYNFSLKNKVDDFTITLLQTTIIYPIVNYLVKPTVNYRNSILYTFEDLPKLDRIKGPKFVFAHIMCPHPPFVFTEDGGMIPAELKLNNVWAENEKKYYLGQLKFLNTQIKKIVEAILQKSDNAVLILQSDHGPAFLGNWENPSSEFIDERSKIFNAIRINNSGQEALYPDISSVNTFRVVLNSLFDEDFQLVNDSTFFSSYKQPYKFNYVR